MIKPIETNYKGYRFRSRLEARWAVFFDALGVAWDYEKEGYDLGDAGWYLPDFWLPSLGIFVEIKPGETSLFGHRHLEVFSQAILICGEPGDYKSYDYVNYGSGTLCADLGVWGTSDEWLGFGFITHRSFSGYLPRECSRSDGFTSFSIAIKDAGIAARSARFEHGESPA